MLEDIKSVVSGVIGSINSSAPLSDERRYDIALILNELLVNSFEHARPTSRNPVFVQVDMVDSILHIGVTDSGSGFEYAKQSAPDEADTLLMERGRGLKLVRALCSDIRYNDAGNSVEVSITL